MAEITLLRSIAGLEEITGGQISIGEKVVNDLPPKDRDIAMVFQNYALYPHMTVEQNLALGLDEPLSNLDAKLRVSSRHPAEALRRAGQPVRGRVHRLPRDELTPRGPASR